MPKKQSAKKLSKPTARTRKVKKGPPSTAKSITTQAVADETTARIFKEAPQAVKGMKDILPKDGILWDLAQTTASALAQAFGYGYIKTPILEQRSLFTRAVGASTDIAQKEMYCFSDQGGDELCLRPEGTAAVARAYINHGMLNMPQPVKLWYLGPFFRREKPQAGRYREFHQWGIEVLGDEHAVLDAEIISIAMAFFADLKIPARLEINSIGCGECREKYKAELRGFYFPKRELLCETCKVRMETNLLRLLDCKEPQCELLREGAPQITDALCEPCRDHFMKVLEYLDEADIAYGLNPYIVRGLDYYNRTVFEIFPLKDEPSFAAEQTQDASGNLDEQKTPEHEKILAAEQDGKVEEEKEKIGSQSALAAGGRYDGLVEQLGGRPTPAVGFSIGMERVIASLRARQAPDHTQEAPRVFIAQLGDSARKKALALWHTLRREVSAIAALSKDGLKPQLEAANRSGVRYAIIIGQKEVLDQTAIIRDMEAGIQEVVDSNKVVGAIKKKLEG